MRFSEIGCRQNPLILQPFGMKAHSDLAVNALVGQDGELPPRDVSLQRGLAARGIAVLGLPRLTLEPTHLFGAEYFNTTFNIPL